MKVINLSLILYRKEFVGYMYKTLIFDLDDTLTDDKANMREAFKILMKYRKEKFSEENFERFYKIDKYVWKERAAGRLLGPYENNNEKKTEWIRAYRFFKYYEENIAYEDAVRANDIYTNGMKEKVVPRENAYETIEYLFKKQYRIIIATNGPTIPLKSKIEKIKIDKFVDTIFSADEIGFMKPSKLYYDGLIRKARIGSKKQILFIGDDLEKDIKGANDNDIDVCWCNYNNEVNNKYNTNYEIHKLEELRNIL